jgi:hypothetical protein
MLNCHLEPLYAMQFFTQTKTRTTELSVTLSLLARANASIVASISSAAVNPWTFHSAQGMFVSMSADP